MIEGFSVKEEQAMRMEKLFPYANEEHLKIYSILSAHSSLANMITDANTELAVTAAYSLDDALRVNDELIKGKHPDDHAFWRKCVRYASCPFQYLVPSEKIQDMVEKIKQEFVPKHEEKVDFEAHKMIAYTKFIFEEAGCSPYEKGILTGVTKRFLEKMREKK